MSLIRKYAAFTRQDFFGALASALWALALFDPGVATAQEVKQIKLTEKHIQSFITAHEEMAKLYGEADVINPMRSWMRRPRP